MDLSVIIVNYNVRYFMEQCLHSLCRASQSLEVEVIVVDNNSSDGSIEYLQPKFQQVVFICNKENTGFAKACNQGLARASGRYILFLNPDTLLAEDTLTTCIRFFETHANAGALGVRMIDGSGQFLKESKRSFPSPLTSLFKLSGLARLFPTSKLFARYHLGHLSAEQNHEVDVLAGAFMMVKKEVLDKVGSFDETFFMYGEDVDLSYRIQQGGFKNYFVADTEIIHFKGESTKRGSLNYVRLFYKAMSLFVQKHYGGSRAWLFHFSIQLAIWVRAFFSAIGKFIRWIGLPVIDAALIFSCFWMVKIAWASLVKLHIVYPAELVWLSFPAFTIVYLVVLYYAGLYDKPFKKTHLWQAAIIATVVLLALYSLLPEHLRFSRGVVLFGSLAAFSAIGLLRWLLLRVGLLPPAADAFTKPHILIAGSEKEYAEVRTLLQANDLEAKIIGRLSVDENKEHELASLKDVATLATALNAQDLVLCAGTLSYKKIIELVQKIKSSLRIRFYAAGSGSIVGSDSQHGSGAVISHQTVYHLAQPRFRRIKRLIDISFSLFFLVLFPLFLFLVKKPFHFLGNSLLVLVAQKTWVGYLHPKDNLPPLRPGVIASNGMATLKGQPQSEAFELVDAWYAQDYEPMQDIKTVLKNYNQLYRW